MENSLTERFKDFISKHHLFTKKDKLLLAVSGGVDSVVLCKLCSLTGMNYGIAHCNFQLREMDSNHDEDFVKDLAAQYEVPFHNVRFETKQFAEVNKIATQEAARILRYEWFEKIRKEWGYDYILTAHHADDNIETVMMNFYRGTGIRGLSGIKEKTGKLRRPLLFVRRMELEQFLNENQLQFVQDKSNFSNDYTRNYFRNTLLPLVSKTYPEAGENILKNIERLKGAELLYEQQIQVLKKKLLKQNGNDFYIPILLLKKQPAMHTILMELLRPFGFRSSQLMDIEKLLDSISGKYVCSTTHRILKNRKHLIVSGLSNAALGIIVINEAGQYQLDNQMLMVEVLKEIAITKNPHEAFLDADKISFPLLLRPWKTGDYFYPLGMEKKKKLSRFFIDKKLSVLEKENQWVVEMNKKIVWIVGHRLDNRFKITDATKSVLKISIFKN